MILQPIRCPNCQGVNLVRKGKTPKGKQRFICRGSVCNGRSFVLEIDYPGHSRQVKQQIVDMALNSSGIRDTARFLHVSTNTVMQELKKKNLNCNKLT